jgi:hypothetical protein
MSYVPSDISKNNNAQPEHIKSIALYLKRNLITENYNNKEEYYSDKFPNFKSRYPTLYEMACGNNIDIGDFNRILTMMTTQLSNNSDDYTRSSQVGQVLYNRYVKDKEQFMKKKDE